MLPGGSVELPPRYARLDGRDEVGGPERQDSIETGEVEADPSGSRDHVPLEARSGAERNDRDAELGRQRDDVRDLARTRRHHDDVRPVRGVDAEVGSVPVEHGIAVAHAPLVRDEPEELRAQIGGDRHA